MNITPQIALQNVLTLYKGARLTPDEHEAMKESLQVLANLINESKGFSGNLEKKKE
jgi:hypothetical protein